jgi:predicted lipoprotein with Yx(FWY)xxD motif
MSVFSRPPAGPRGLAWMIRFLLATALAGSGAAVMAGVSAASATHSHAKATSAVVVKVAKRPTIGKMLVVPGTGRALYILPSGTCTGSCTQVWPALVMPAGATVPKGARCLGTVAFGTNQLQVTYHKQPLYTFAQDSGHSVSGNGVAGFKAAKVTTACP